MATDTMDTVPENIAFTYNSITQSSKSCQRTIVIEVGGVMPATKKSSRSSRTSHLQRLLQRVHTQYTAPHVCIVGHGMSRSYVGLPTSGFLSWPNCLAAEPITP
ncbi:hypothetical protein J6590_042762 [Homalodisca vitripennis]|nr:hypothetical protein J6590_042762 [Homalodisca vitripennis]